MSKLKNSYVSGDVHLHSKDDVYIKKVVVPLIEEVQTLTNIIQVVLKDYKEKKRERAA